MSGKTERGTAKIGCVTLGKGLPAVCVPVMGASLEEIAKGAARAKQAQADIIELRIDSLCEMPQRDAAIAACDVVRKEAQGIPLLFTLRTKRDGGAGSADADAYEALLKEMIQSGACDAVDCELSAGRAVFLRIAALAHEKNVTLVGSSHEFGEIGDMQRAGQWLIEQEELGADICKAAVMTKSSVQAMEAALMFARTKEQLGVPMIGIAMGPYGVMTRVCGACMGSCLTFGTAGMASAPGQIDARRLRTALEIVQDALI